MKKNFLFFVGKSVSRRRAHGRPFFELRLCLVNIQSFIWFCYSFLTLFWAIDFLIPFLRLKKDYFKKRATMGPPPWDALSNKKKTNYVDRTSGEIIGMPNEPFLTLFWLISSGNLKISGWKFYGSLLFLAPTYPESFI